MKKAIIRMLILTLIVSVAVGITGCGSIQNNKMVGVYITDSWHGTTGTLVLYKDGTCQYPSAETAEWEVKDDAVIISLKEKQITLQSMDVYFDAALSDAEKRSVTMKLSRLDNVEGIQYFDEESTKYARVSLETAETDDTTYHAIQQMDGIADVKHATDYSEEMVTVAEHEAKIMEKGLVLNKQFFEKVSD